ncbi:helix-turn-helix transcriptional regulator [bacterium]|nr:helix-turn-helix transcriptional regulator [bacterium]
MDKDEIIRKNIGAKIKAGRINKGLTQSALAEKVNMDEKQLSRLEAGKHYPTLKTLLAITEVLEMKLGDFDDIKDLKEPTFYTLVDILRTSNMKDLKKYLSIIKIIKE